MKSCPVGLVSRWHAWWSSLSDLVYPAPPRTHIPSCHCLQSRYYLTSRQPTLNIWSWDLFYAIVKVLPLKPWETTFPRNCARRAWYCKNIEFRFCCTSKLCCLDNQESPPQTKPKKGPKRKVHEFRPFLWIPVFFLRKTSTIHTLNFCSRMPLRKVHELTFLWFGLPGRHWRQFWRVAGRESVLDFSEFPQTCPEVPQRLPRTSLTVDLRAVQRFQREVSPEVPRKFPRG